MRVFLLKQNTSIMINKKRKTPHTNKEKETEQKTISQNLIITE